MEWTEQDSKDAQRLLQRLDERSNRRKTLAGGESWVPAQITESRTPVPACLEKAADSERLEGSGCLNRCPPVNTDQGGQAGDHAIEGVADSGWENCGQVFDQGKCWPAEGVAVVSTTCPRSDAKVIASGFTVPVLKGNAHRRNEE